MFKHVIFDNQVIFEFLPASAGKNQRRVIKCNKRLKRACYWWFLYPACLYLQETIYL